MQLETNRFLLRPLGSGDVPEDYFSWLTDENITRYLHIFLEDYSEEDARSYIDGHDNRNGFFFGIFTKDEQFIGTHSVKGSQKSKKFSIGGLIGARNFWGQNVIVETRAELLDFGFNELNQLKAEAGCYASNRPALYNFLRQGWEKEGVLRANRTVEKVSDDLILFGLLKHEWVNRNSVS